MTAAIRMPLLDIPFERDEGAYAYIAWRQGFDELPYRDWIDQKPPGVFWAYRLASVLPGDAVSSVHLMALVWSAASAIAVFFVALRFLDGSWATVAAALFAILSADPAVQGTAANTELFMLLPLILSQMFFFGAVDERPAGPGPMLLSGVMIGAAIAFKQVAAVHAPFLVAVYPLFLERGPRLRKTVVFAAWLGAGAAIVWVSIAAYFAAHRALGDLVHHVFTHNLQYINATPWAVRWTYAKATLSTLIRTEVVAWALSAVALISLLRRGRMRRLVFLAGWWLAGLIGVSASGYFFPHYFQQLVPVFAVAATIGAATLCQVKAWRRVPAAGRYAVLGLALAVPPVLTLHAYAFTYTPAEAVRKMYPGNPFAEMPELGRWIAHRTRPDDRVFIFGTEPEVLFHARRASATRYIFLVQLYGPYRDARRRQEAVAEEIASAWPAMAVYLPNQLFFVPGSEQYLTNWTRSYLREQFRIDAYLAMDEAGRMSVVPNEGAEPVLPEGRRVVGVVFARATANVERGR